MPRPHLLIAGVTFDQAQAAAEQVRQWLDRHPAVGRHVVALGVEEIPEGFRVALHCQTRAEAYALPKQIAGVSLAVHYAGERAGYIVDALVRATEEGRLHWEEAKPRRYAAWGGAHWIRFFEGPTAALSVVIDFGPREELTVDPHDASRLHAVIKTNLQRGVDRGQHGL